MRTVLMFVRRRLREYAYLLTTFPIAVALFVLVQIGFATVFLPLAVFLLLGLLTVMEPIARFEIRRTNALLKTDFRTIDNWFSKPFFSWDGAKERVTSLRSWMAIGYVFVAFGVSTVGFAIGLSGLVLAVGLLVGLGLLGIAPFTRAIDIASSDGSRAELSIEFVGRSVRLDLFTIDGLDELVVTSGPVALDNVLTIAVVIVGTFLLLWAASGLARGLAHQVEGLLSGVYLPRVETELKRLTNEFRVSERDVREAMEQPALQPELSELSSRQREILALMAQGKSNAGIAKALYITEGSVEKHVSNILSRLNLPLEEDSHRRVLAVLTYLGIDTSAAARQPSSSD